ncbi:MAG: hypothetical protein J6331_08450 [Lentisphaeria bacterium]|nr:hypothetical protein [Lentisphaeria bacterium]
MKKNVFPGPGKVPLFVLLFSSLLSASSLLLPAAEKENQRPPRTVRELSKDAPYLFPGAEITFPPVVAGYRKVAVVENANPVYGTVIRYAGTRGESADIYLYSNDTGASLLREKDLPEEYEKTRGMLLKGREKSSPLVPVKEEVKLLREEIRKGSGGNAPLYRCDFRCSLGDERYDSTLILSLLTGGKKPEAEKEQRFIKFVKIRLSRSSEVVSGKEDAEKFLAELFGILFPGASSTPAPVPQGKGK